MDVSWTDFLFSQARAFFLSGVVFGGHVSNPARWTVDQRLHHHHPPRAWKRTFLWVVLVERHVDELVQNECNHGSSSLVDVFVLTSVERFVAVPTLFPWSDSPKNLWTCRNVCVCKRGQRSPSCFFTATPRSLCECTLSRRGITRPRVAEDFWLTLWGGALLLRLNIGPRPRTLTESHSLHHFDIVGFLSFICVVLRSTEGKQIFLHQHQKPQTTLELRVLLN